MHRSTEELEAQLDHILAAPSDGGAIEMIVRRPAENERDSIESGHLDSEVGLVGDSWANRGEPHKSAQLTLMSSRVISAIAGSRNRWPLAGDQVYVDMDLSTDNLPAGTRLKIGEAIVEVSSKPHTGCAKFASRYGKEALRWVNVGEGRHHRFRGMYAVVVESGDFRVGDKVQRL